jgi:hypothetical protein
MDSVNSQDDGCRRLPSQDDDTQLKEVVDASVIHSSPNVSQNDASASDSVFQGASCEVQVSSSVAHDSDDMLSEEADILGLVLSYPIQEQQHPQQDNQQERDMTDRASRLCLFETDDQSE